MSTCFHQKKTLTRFVIITIYVDDLNIIRTRREIQKTSNYLKEEFEMTNKLSSWPTN